LFVFLYFLYLLNTGFVWQKLVVFKKIYIQVAVNWLSMAEDALYLYFI